MIHRFKQELIKHSGNVEKSVRETLKTAGHTVLFAGVTVVSAMSALFIMEEIIKKVFC